MKPKLPIGIVYAFTAAALFGASTPLSKLLLGSVDPWLLAGLLYLGSGFGLSLWLLDIREFTWARIGPATWWRRFSLESVKHCFCLVSLS